MFQATNEDVLRLGDDELRDLIGLLCESVFAKYCFSTASIMYGGDQDAADGGVDVYVNSNFDIPEGDYIPRGKTIFQVKVPDMAPADIKKEMLKNGLLKDAIKKVGIENGAYIIVSSKSNLSHKMYEKRLSAMKECISENDNLPNFFLDFYDLKRIVSWVNSYPSIIVWVKNKNGHTFSSWLSYIDWKKTNRDFENDFISDNESFMYKNNYLDKNKIPLLDGINQIRDDLNSEAKSIRIAGLSGVGKTRLAYSLFDRRIGKNALDSSLLIYCDIGNSPNPSPIALIQYLVKLERRLIIIVDNCIKEEHSKLAELINYKDSKLSLLTIEYDAKQDDEIGRAHV